MTSETGAASLTACGDFWCSCRLCFYLDFSRRFKRLTKRQGFKLCNQVARHRQGSALTYTSHHAVQAVKTAFEHDHAGVIKRHATFGNGFEQGLHRMAQFADRENAGHASAAFQGM